MSMSPAQARTHLQGLARRLGLKGFIALHATRGALTPLQFVLLPRNGKPGDFDLLGSQVSTAERELRRLAAILAPLGEKDD